jgi:hypothetical protein
MTKRTFSLASGVTPLEVRVRDAARAAAFHLLEVLR